MERLTLDDVHNLCVEYADQNEYLFPSSDDESDSADVDDESDSAEVDDESDSAEVDEESDSADTNATLENNASDADKENASETAPTMIAELKKQSKVNNFPVGRWVKATTLSTFILCHIFKHEHISM